MRKSWFLLASVLFLLLPVNVQASNICDFSEIPSYPSLNSSMLLIIPRSTAQTQLSGLSEPIKIGWELRETDLNFLDWGSMLKFNDCWVCEFSGEISNFYGNCGPTPFRKSGEFLLSYIAKDFGNEKEFNRSILIHSKKMSVGVNVDSNGVVHITVDAPTNTEEVWVSLYDAETGEGVQGFQKTNLTGSDYPGRYYMDITSLSAGVYYASFGFRTTSVEAGGTVAKFEIAEKVIELTAETDKKSYFLGETVAISGQTKYSQVSASVKYPSGRTESLGSKSVVGRQLSYNFQLLTSYEEGEYVVTVNAGNKTVQYSFSAGKLLDVSPLSLSFQVTNLSGKLEKTVTVQNIGNTTVTLSAGSEGVTDYVTLTFDKRTLSPAGTSTLTVELDPAKLVSSVTGKVLVTGNSVTIPVSTAINLDLQTGVPVTGGP